MKKLLFASALIALIAPLAHAADSPWLGTWKLDPAKSHFTGETFTYSTTANGMMRYSDGTSPDTEFRVDGKEYPLEAGWSTKWVTSGQNSWDSTRAHNGKILSKTHRTLSADGKTYSLTSTNFQPDGGQSTTNSTWTRVTGTMGLVGTWKSTKVDSGPDMNIVTAKSDGVLRWETPSWKFYMEGKLDGSEILYHGPTVPPDMTIAFTATSPTTLSYIVRRHGKTLSLGTQTLATDGKSYVDVSWSPGKEDEKTDGFYVKQ